jgi:hypothetical protein
MPQPERRPAGPRSPEGGAAYPEADLPHYHQAAHFPQELHLLGQFEMGQLMMTPGADETLRAARQVHLEFFLRHKNDDWGELPEEAVRKTSGHSKTVPASSPPIRPRPTRSCG